jgi:hypothetical protein
MKGIYTAGAEKRLAGVYSGWTTMDSGRKLKEVNSINKVTVT